MWQHMFSVLVMRTVRRRELDSSPASVLVMRTVRRRELDWSLAHDSAQYALQSHYTYAAT